MSCKRLSDPNSHPIDVLKLGRSHLGLGDRADPVSRCDRLSHYLALATTKFTNLPGTTITFFTS